MELPRESEKANTMQAAETWSRTVGCGEGAGAMTARQLPVGGCRSRNGDRLAQPAAAVLGLAGLDGHQGLAQALGVGTDVAVADRIFLAFVNKGADAGEDGGGAGQRGLAGAN